MNEKRTKTGDLVQVSECKENGVTYGVIAIELKQQYQNLSAAGEVLLEFMQQLQPTFGIQHSTGTSEVTAVTQTQTAVVDYWQDADGIDWKVKGCTDGARMAVLYIKNITNVPVEKETIFLNGFFPPGVNFQKRR